MMVELHLTKENSMEEISREEVINYLENTKEEKICKDCNYVPCSAREECEKQLSYLDKAISDMEKLEKIEQMIDECRAWTDDMAECLIEIEQIVKG